MKDDNQPNSTDPTTTEAHDDANVTELENDARDTLNEAVDSVPDGSAGEVKSRDPEYYGDR